jgi:hypothetical protein
MGDFDPARIESLTGAFNVDTDKMHVEIGVLTMGAAALTVSCPNGPPIVQAKRPGTSFTWPVDAPVTLFGSEEDYSFDIGIARFIDKMTVEPKLNSCH